MKKLIFGLILLTTLIGYSAEPASAAPNVVSGSAELKSVSQNSFDFRVFELESYLSLWNSPLESYARTFVGKADNYSLDWRLVPAITGVESAFGKRIPLDSFNAYGWANGAYSFESWDESIEVVAKTLREKYYDRGAEDINQIARRYAPPSTTWAGNVKIFMTKISRFPVTFTLES